MARVNYQQVVERLLVWASQPQRTNIGQRDLLRAIGAFVEEATLDEDAYYDFMERFGVEVLESVLNLLPDDQAAIPPGTTSQGATHGPTQPHMEEPCRKSKRGASSPPPGARPTRPTDRSALALTAS